MRLFSALVFSLYIISPLAAAQDFSNADIPKEKHNYESDVARLRKIVINSLYSHKEIFLRELISNANDAIEKLRMLSLTDKSIYDGTDPLNITIQAVKNEDGQGGRLIITDTGIGMTPQELTTNLGTLAKSGTSDFLKQAENDDGTNTGNLIGAFGLGFYSSFLVADKVYVVSVPPKTPENPDPVQHVFSSSADDSSFEIFPDPRGNTLGRGTEITLELKSDSLDYLQNIELAKLINKHSSFSTAFPIYMHEIVTKEVPDEDDTPEPSTSSEAVEPSETAEKDEDEAIVEDVTDEQPKEEPPKKTKKVEVENWSHINPQPPIWMRDPKEVTDEDYVLFYNSFWKDFNKPLAWTHFSAETGSGTPFKAIIYLPGQIDEQYWSQPLASSARDVRLMVKRVFITSDLGEDSLPKWASWVKVVVDAEDLPLNVSRETLQSNYFLRQLKQVILKRIIQLLNKIAAEDSEKWQEIQKVYGTILKLGSVEDTKNRDKLTVLTRFNTNLRNMTSLDEYVESKKKGQKQIFYLAEMGKDAEDIAKSVFVEKLHARGYEVLLLSEPLDEIMVQNLKKFKNMPFQDIAKVGLKFGDEDLDEEEEKQQQEELKEKFKPLLDYLRKEADEVVRDVVISNRLVTSPCAVVADTHGYTANVQKMMSASNAQSGKGYLHEFAKKAKLLEINPRSPLIEGLLLRVERMPEDETERDPDDVAELKEVSSILIDGALIRSGFEVPDTNDFFSRVDRVLRRSLGVSETAPTDDSVKPAPPVDPEPLAEDETEVPFQFPPGTEKPGVYMPGHPDVQIEMEEIDDEGNVIETIKQPQGHDEL